jgi:hypothetical protein
VHKFGKPTDFQKAMVSLWLEIFGVIKSAVDLGQEPKIEILRKIQGIVKPAVCWWHSVGPVPGARPSQR